MGRAIIDTTATPVGGISVTTTTTRTVIATTMTTTATTRIETIMRETTGLLTINALCKGKVNL